MNTTSTAPRTSHRAARHAFIVLALTLAAMLLPFGAPVAHAAPPGVTASENPVTIAIKTKEITLTWTLAPFELAGKLIVTESGTPDPVLNETVSSLTGTGAEPLTVTNGKTYTAQLTDAFTNQPVGAPLTITTKRVDNSIPVDSCDLRVCITGPDVEPHGGWAQFTINTNQKAIMTLEASPAPPNADGTWSNPNDVAAKAATILPTQNWTPPLPNLVSNTTYHYVVRAHDTNGNEQVKSGSFKTLTRRVEVTFAEIEMFDDSDGAGAGDCDCFFLFNAGDETPKPYGDLVNPKSIASGTSVHPNVTITVTSPLSPMRIRAMGYDDDMDFGEACHALGISYPEAYTGAANWQSSGNKEECYEWAGGQTDVSVSRQGPSSAPGDVDEEFTESFQFYVGGELHYTVHGNYKVTYVP